MLFSTTNSTEFTTKIKFKLGKGVNQRDTETCFQNTSFCTCSYFIYHCDANLSTTHILVCMHHYRLEISVG